MNFMAAFAAVSIHSPMILPAMSRLAPKPESGAGSTTPSGFSWRFLG
jgi:hypothetical protein